MVLHGCNSVTRIKADVNLDNIFQEKLRENLFIVASLKPVHSEKACGRDTYNPTSMYKMCGVDKVMELLPASPASPSAYIKYLISVTSPKGKLFV